jgi:protein TonB
MTPAAGPSEVKPSYDADYLKNPPPQYPFTARRLGIEGTVVLRVWVSAEGLPDRVSIVKSSGSTLLDRAGLKAVQRWRFVPARRAGAAVADWVEVDVRFDLDEAKPPVR